MEKEPTIEELKNFLGEYLELKGVNTSSVFRCFSPEHEDRHPSMSFIKKVIFAIALLVVKNIIFLA